MNAKPRVFPPHILIACVAVLQCACSQQDQAVGTTVQQLGSTDRGAIEYVETDLGPGARQGFLLLHAQSPRGSAILFAGGHGVLNLRKGGTLQRGGNFLVRVRKDFVDAGYNVALVDTPSDRRDLKFFGTTAHRATDIKGVIAYLRELNSGPVWLIGTSRGTVSVASVAARLAKDPGGPDGLVLTSTVTESDSDATTSVYNADLPAIRVPVLIVSHKADLCFVSPMSASRILADRLRATTVVGFQAFSGGNPATSGPCEPFSPHGYFGIESQVTQAITAWMREHEAKK